MSVSIVIVSWNGCADLEKCLSSLKQQSSRIFEIIVIDNHSSDGTLEMVQQKFPEVILKEMRSNLGFAEGCNRGIDIATGDWICTLNPDTEVAPDWLENVETAIGQANDDVGMLQPKVLFKHDREIINSTGMVLLITGSSGDRGFNTQIDRNQTAEEIFIPSASAAVYRMSMLSDVRLNTGYFDRSFFMYVEDLDLGWRCRLAGWKAYYIPEATVFHGYKRSSKKRGREFADLQCRKNRIRALIKNGSIGFIIASVPKTFYDLLIGFRHSGPGIFSEFYAAFKGGLSQRKSVTEMLKLSRSKV